MLCCPSWILASLTSSPFPSGGIVPFSLVLCHWWWLVCDSRVVVLPVEVCHGVDTVVIVVSERRLTNCGLLGGGVPSWWHSCVCVSWRYLVVVGTCTFCRY